MLSKSDGEELVKLARKTVERFFNDKKPLIEKTKFSQKRGVFVSIHTHPDHDLRGCIGFPYPEVLGEAVQKASLSAAFKDPRFPPLKKEEIKHVIFEVSVLTEPEIIRVKNPREYLKKIIIGEDGLIVERGFRKGLLLPQVPLQFKPVWDAETFLQHTCEKAGLFYGAWLDSGTKVYKFQAQIFKEKEPCGEIIQT